MRFLAGLAVLWLWSGLAAAGPELRICMADVEHKPWRVADPDGRVRGRGFDFDLIRAVEQKTGWSFRVDAKPGKRCLQEMEAGYSDALVGLSYTPEREVYLRYPVKDGVLDDGLALRVDRYRLYRLQGAPVRWDGQRLELPSGGKVGVTIGHSVASKLQALRVEVDERSRSAEMALRLLKAGQLAAVALHQSEADALLAHRPDLKGIERLPVPLMERPYFVVFTKRFAQSRDADLKLLWQAFRDASRTAAYQQAVQELSR